MVHVIDHEGNILTSKFSPNDAGFDARPFVLHILLLITIALLACTTEKTVYVMPDGTEVTSTAAQATQAADGGSQTAAPQSSPSKSASENAAPAPSQSASPSTQARAPAPAANPRWNDKRNTLCSSLGLDAGVCEKIALNQTGLDGETQDIALPDEPDATPVPIDDVGDAVDELQKIVASEGEVSIQVLTYTESLIQQAADAIVQAEQELANPGNHGGISRRQEAGTSGTATNIRPAT